MGRGRKDMPENGNKADWSKGVPNREARRRKKGQSGNPGGKPRTGAFAQACRDVLAAPVPGDREALANAEDIAWRLAEMVRAGNVRAAVELADRTEGRERASLWRQRTPL
jgi:hypothetical protein